MLSREQLSPILKHINMKSRISIEVDFENNNQPVIQILQDVSDDVRDKLIRSFTENLGGSSWCQIKWQPNSVNGMNKIYISPISQSQLKEQAEIML